MIRIRDDAVPRDLHLDLESGVGFTTLAREDREVDGLSSTPELVAYYTNLPNRRRLMVTAIPSLEPSSLIVALAGHWSTWPIASGEGRAYRRMGSDDPGNSHVQIAWAANGTVVWVIADGIEEDELAQFVDGVLVFPD